MFQETIKIMKITKNLFRHVFHNNLGLQSYSVAMETMRSVVKNKIRVKEASDYILTCEHRPVYTVGIRTNDYADEKISDDLKRLNADFEYTDRGGLITFHGPGQLVCYPVFNLKNYNITLRCYINKLEEVVIDTCKHFGVIANRTNDIGIWIGNDKIAAIGVHCSRHVTSHGLALNCNTDLSWFQHIVPCGLYGRGVTSLSKLLHHDVTIKDVLPVLLDNFENVFQCRIVSDAT